MGFTGRTNGRIAQLYAARGLLPDCFAALNRGHAAPVCGDLKVWLAGELTAIPDKSPLTAAIRYALIHANRPLPEGLLFRLPGSWRQDSRHRLYPLITTAELKTVDPHT